MDAKFLKPYNPKETEDRIYKKWEESGFFNPDKLPAWHQKPFTIIMPPPNVTGVLHMGHALALAIEDIMVRFERMRGKKTLWLPGTDHAAIATQSVVEKEISKKEKKTRYDLGREELLKRINNFAKESHDTIMRQVRATGASCDWSREAFTLDEARNKTVNTVFKKMYDDGLVYRGFRLVNWDPKGQTTISDDEIVYKEEKTKFYTFKYSKNFPISISTTRPETKLGDVAVAVHPEDDRYRGFVGKTYDVIFCGENLKIKIVADTIVDKEFGTGAVGITPSHSFIDWEMSERHSLPRIQVIDERGKMTVKGSLNGKKINDAREKIVDWLKSEGLLEKEEEISHNVATAERTGGLIEPLPKLQWFVNVNKEIPGRGSLKDMMRKPVENGEIKIIPDNFVGVYFHWIFNLRDWCISRQIWYGHRIPVWYRQLGDTKQGISNFQFSISKQDSNPQEIYVGIESPAGEGWVQDEDTLDTWFSSSLWTFSTLGWPEKTRDLETYHPTDVLETGYEILFFWVARMILMSEYALNQIPFKTVYLHGTIRDSKGRKMSKSLGNGIDPLDMAEKYGSDAMRLSLIIGNTPGTDMRISEDKIRGYKLFANKIWNISRFVLENTADYKGSGLEKLDKLAELAEIKELEGLTKDVTADLENYRFYLAAEKLYHYVWHTLADKIIEESKAALKEGVGAERQAAQGKLLFILRRALILLHPFMPFITEEIWGSLPGNNELLLIEKWPK